MYERNNVICTYTIMYFCVSSLFDPVLNFTMQNHLVYQPISRMIQVMIDQRSPDTCQISSHNLASK